MWRHTRRGQRVCVCGCAAQLTVRTERPRPLKPLGKWLSGSGQKRQETNKKNPLENHGCLQMCVIAKICRGEGGTLFFLPKPHTHTPTELVSED